MSNTATEDLGKAPEVEPDLDITKFPLYTDGPRPIAQKKLDDLLALCEHLPPANREYYQSLVGDCVLDSESSESSSEEEDE